MTLLDRETPDDPELRAEVESLLEQLDQDHESNGSDALSDSAIEASRRQLESTISSPVTFVPDRIGNYRIVRRLGEGGMGVVYEAMQESPRRRVAIKLLHPSLATPDRLRRFQQEAELLGRLHHPGIAQVYEAGTHDIGSGAQPFFAMEYVDGVNLRAYCERESLDTAARFELLARVCDAVHYAHDHEVIHRDLKPDNVLVDEHGQPKVLDFGIARATRTSTVISTIVTEEGQLVGTLPYMAPEQLRGSPDAVTERVDIYALGVLGFELLAGRLPHIIDDLPISAAVSVLAHTDAPRLGKLQPSMKGDVETIIGTAMESEVDRRYASASALAGDIRRHLDHQPITARPPSRVYLARKFARRHRAVVSGTVATVIVLVIGIIVSLFLLDQVTQQRDRADEEAISSAAVILESAGETYDRGGLWQAYEKLMQVTETRRTWPWKLLERAMPRVLDAPIGSYRGAYAEPLIKIDAEGGLSLYDIRGIEPRRRLFTDMKFLGIGGPTHTGFALAATANETLLLDVPNDRVVETFPLQSDPPVKPYRQGVSDDGRVVIVRTAHGRAEVIRDGETVRTFDDRIVKKAGSGYDDLAILPDGSALVIVEPDGVRIEDLESGETLFEQPLMDGRPSITARVFDRGVLIRFGAGDADRGASDPVVRVELTDEGVELGQVFSSFGNPKLSGDGRIAGLGGWGETRLLDTRTGEPIPPSLFVDDNGAVKSPKPELSGIAVSHDGQTAVHQSSWSRPFVIDLNEPPRSRQYDPRAKTLVGHTNWVYHLAVSHDGSLIASAAPQEHVIRLWDAVLGEQIATIPRRPSNHDSWDAMIAFTPDDERLVVTTPVDGVPGVSVLSWDFATGEVNVVASGEVIKGSHMPLINTFIEAVDPGPRTRLHQRGQMLGNRAEFTFASPPLGMTVGPYKNLPHSDLWRDPVRELFPDEGGSVRHHALGLSVHPTRDEITFAGIFSGPYLHADYRGWLRTLDAQTGEILAEVELDEYPWCVAHSADGTLIVVGHDNGSLTFIESEFHTTLLRMQAHGDYIYSLAWLPDGRLVTASGDTMLRIWDTRPAMNATPRTMSGVRCGSRSKGERTWRM